MKKLFLMAGALAAVLSLASCNSDKKESNSLTSQTAFVDNYFLSGINGVSLLETKTSGLKGRALPDQTKQEIISNFEMFEELLGSEVVKSEALESDDSNYSHKYLVELNLLDGSVEQYVYYYNETIIEEEFDETESIIDGIVLVDGQSYDLRGEREIEDGEEEVKYRVSLDNQSYVVIEQEKEYDGESYSYTSYSNGRKVYEFEVEKEVENNKTEYEIKQKDGNNSYQYEIIERNDFTLVEVEVKENNSMYKVRFKISYDELGNRNYEFIE